MAQHPNNDIDHTNGPEFANNTLQLQLYTQHVLLEGQLEQGWLSGLEVIHRLQL